MVSRPRRRRGRAAVHAALTRRCPARRASGGCSPPVPAGARPAATRRSTCPPGSVTTRPRSRPTGSGCARARRAGGVPGQVHGTRVATVTAAPDPDEPGPPGHRRRGHRRARVWLWPCWPPTACRCCWPTRSPGWSARRTPAGSGPRPGCCRPRVAAMDGARGPRRCGRGGARPGHLRRPATRSRRRCGPRWTPRCRAGGAHPARHPRPRPARRALPPGGRARRGADRRRPALHAASRRTCTATAATAAPAGRPRSSGWTGRDRARPGRSAWPGPRDGPRRAARTWMNARSQRGGTMGHERRWPREAARARAAGRGAGSGSRPACAGRRSRDPAADGSASVAGRPRPCRRRRRRCCSTSG